MFWSEEMLCTVSRKHCHSIKIIRYSQLLSVNCFAQAIKKEGLLAVATLRKDRLKDAGKFLKSEKELKKSNRGSFDYVVDYDSGITILRWFDNSSVQLISNNVGNDLGEPARRWVRKNTWNIQIQSPKMVETYNANMGGVYLCYKMLSTYRIRQKSNKHYTHIIYYCIGISVTNSWLIYRRHMAQQSISKK